MSHLILTTDDLAARHLRSTSLASEVVGFDLRFVLGKLPSDGELATFLEPRSAKHDREGKHWLDHFCRMGLERTANRTPGLLACCDGFGSIELWVDPGANDQLIPVWLLDVLRPHKELPDSLNGLGASEQLMLESLKYGCTDPGGTLYMALDRDVVNEREAGDLFDELAQCPKPLVFGLGEAPFDPDPHTRYRRYRNAKVALTRLGQEVVEAQDDFCRHNPIRRWWGGTELTSERLWRWDRETRSLIAP